MPAAPNLIIADLDKFLIPSQVPKTKAEWLKAYGKMFSYQPSFPLINAAHKITVQSEIDEAAKAIYTAIPLQNIINDLKNAGGDYTDDNYDFYVKLINGSTGIIHSIVSDYIDSSGISCYSIALIKSILDKYQLPVTIDLEFAEVVFPGKTTIVMRPQGFPAYYDYSQQPALYLIKTPL